MTLPVRLAFRDIQPDDFENMHDIASHWSVVRQLGGWPWPPDPEATKNRCKPYEGDGFVWAICTDETLIGSIGITRGDLGYMLSPAYHGQGIMSRAARTAVTHAFETTDHDHLTASTWYDNLASYAVLRKLGFVHWQSRYIRAKARGRPTMVYHLLLTRSDWYRLRTAAD